MSAKEYTLTPENSPPAVSPTLSHQRCAAPPTVLSNAIQDQFSQICPRPALGRLCTTVTVPPSSIAPLRPSGILWALFPIRESQHGPCCMAPKVSPSSGGASAPQSWSNLTPDGGTPTIPNIHSLRVGSQEACLKPTSVAASEPL